MGTIQANFDHLWIRFEKDGRCFELKREPELTFRKVSIKTLSKEAINVGECFMVQMKDFMDTKQMETVATYMAKLKEEYGTVFADELGLPPRRECDHAIRLHSGATPPNVRPYHYPHI